jgi:hypothetical protein
MLRKRIQELQHFRRMGLTTAADIDKYENDSIKRVMYSFVSTKPCFNSNACSRMLKQTFHAITTPQIDCTYGLQGAVNHQDSLILDVLAMPPLETLKVMTESRLRS